MGPAGLKLYLAPGFLLFAAVLPAAGLLTICLVPAFAVISGAPVVRALFLVVPLSTFLLAFLLFQARSRLHASRVRDAKAVAHVALDPLLPGLSTRPAFDALLETVLARATLDAPVALFAIDIDRFKIVNETHGFGVGDQLLAGVVERVGRIIRDRDGLARIGGDRFALMISDVASASHCAAMAHRIRDAMLAPFEIDGLTLVATVSSGIALCPPDGDSGRTLAAAADLALERAKREGRNRFAFFDSTMEQKLHLGMTIEEALRVAIAADALTILYQPLMDSGGVRMRGVEALVRWQHPTLGLISPDDFIPLAERRGLIAPLGEWVLRRACHDARRWPAMRVAVNVSPVQFRDRGFLDMVKTVIAESGIDTARLELELTEGVLIQDAEQAEAIIMDLRALGIRMGLDDFGSGYSSMIYLRRFAFDKIKIDKALLDAMEARGESAIILDSIITLGHALGLTVTAEGVETREQVEFLRNLGCDELQGYYFSEPCSADAIDAMLSLHAAEARPALSPSA